MAHRAKDSSLRTAAPPCGYGRIATLTRALWASGITLTSGCSSTSMRIPTRDRCVYCTLVALLRTVYTEHGRQGRPQPKHCYRSVRSAHDQPAWLLVRTASLVPSA
jgi:hypothetical protein